jgi:hypothetical protein
MTAATNSGQPTVVRWQRGVPVYGIPVFTRPFAILAAVAALGISLSVYREYAGLGPASGMNDAYAWGIWKTFNVMVLTGLGSGGFAVGIAAWIFIRRNLHAVMRTALLTSFIAYLTGLMALAVDVGRPWNIYQALLPWRWNAHSPMLDIILCMPAYAFFPLLLENIPPVLERWYSRWEASRPFIDRIMPVIRVTYPWVVALAYTLPMMHQSALGALMLLGADKVHPLWQSPLLPLLYLWAAAFLGFACVILTLILCCMFWKRRRDRSRRLFHGFRTNPLRPAVLDGEFSPDPALRHAPQPETPRKHRPALQMDNPRRLRRHALPVRPDHSGLFAAAGRLLFPVFCRNPHLSWLDFRRHHDLSRHGEKDGYSSRAHSRLVQTRRISKRPEAGGEITNLCPVA